MNSRGQVSAAEPRTRRGERGLALALCLLLLTLFTLLGLPTLAAAIVELRLAQNDELQDRAFQAAEYALHQAVQAAALATTDTYGAPQLTPATGTVPVPGTAGDRYSFRLYFARAMPAAASDPAAPPSGQLEFHFVVEGSGYAARGATDTHVQGFKVVRDASWTSDATTPPCSPGPGCVAPAGPVRTFWYAQGGD
jgi:hypothetical protein